MTKIFLLVCALPGILAQCEVEQAGPLLQGSLREFGAELTGKLAEVYDNHFVTSTLSEWALLAAASLGAAGKTLDEFAQVLRLQTDPCINERYFELVNSVASDTLEKSSSIFVDENLGIKDEFSHKLNKTGASLVSLPFTNTNALAETINAYVATATHDLIKDITKPSELEDVKMIMVDAIYFKSSWRVPFWPSSTRVKPFYDDRGTKIGKVNSMTTFGVFNFTITDSAKVLELTYGSDGRYAMLVFLPLNTISNVIHQLKYTNLENIYSSFSPIVANVHLPRFKITSDLSNLKILIKDMGVISAFDRMLAEFPYISDTELYISNVVQKASVEVTEQGTTASAASAGFFVPRSSPEEIKVNRPFLYMILDKETMLPLFTGSYSKPSVY